MTHALTSQCPVARAAGPSGAPDHGSLSPENGMVPPIADWVDLSQISRDPYPIYRRLREESPVAWIPGLNKYMVTSFEGCRVVESNQEIFSANVGSGAMARALGARPMLRKDDPEHMEDRKAINPTLRPKNLREVWVPRFEENARTYLDHLRDQGPLLADLNSDFAGPLAARNLIDLLGLEDVGVVDMQRWSTDFIDGIANVLDRAEVWERCDASQAQVDDVLESLVPYYRNSPNQSILSALANSGMADSEISANIKLTISGGLNEPKHMVTSTVWALDQHPEQRERILREDSLWDGVFDETVRWLSPIGMAPRETTRPTVLDGYSLPAGAPVGLGLASANRDTRHFDNDPDVFDVTRAKQPHMAFGSGTHFCAGQWAARLSIGQVAVPLLYKEFPGLVVDSTRTAAWDGWVFRGLTALPVTWS